MISNIDLLFTFRFFFIDELTGFEVNVFQVRIYEVKYLVHYAI
jgi:hypothetical protein